MTTSAINRKQIIESSFWVLLFWIVIGLLIHIWVPHGQDAHVNIIHVQDGPLMTRLVHLSYIFFGYTIYNLLQWTGITSLHSLAIISIISLAVGGWAIFKIGYNLNGKIFGWSLSLLTWPLPLLIQQAQGQEYQPFALSMLALAWYFWIIHKSLIATAFSWAVSVLANPAHAFLFASFTAFSLLENEPIKDVIKISIKLWLLSATLVVAVLGPFYQEFFFGQTWAVAHTSRKWTFDFSRYFKSGAYLGYAFLTSFYIIIFALPFKRIIQRIKTITKESSGNVVRNKTFLWILTFILSVFFIYITVGSSTYGRYYSPVIHWLALFCFIGTYKLMDNIETSRIMKRWLWIGTFQLLFVVFVAALPFKLKIYNRYDDYNMLTEKYSHVPIISSGFSNIAHYNNVNKKPLQIIRYSKKHKEEISDIMGKLDSGQIEFFILSYGIDPFEKTLLKKILPHKLIQKMNVQSSNAKNLFYKDGFNVKLEPLGESKGGEIYLCRSDTKI